jgi:hypothetical protein|tara:strand:+ start:741 stop:1502 length:762 start_codon:yes stop_codon:yes gene_type:complete
MDYLAQGLRRIPLTGPVSALFYKKLHTKFYSINKNNSLPVQISFYNYKHDVLFNAPKEIHPDQVDDTNSFNFAIIRNPYERSISLADALYFAQVKVKYKTVPSTMYHCIEDPEYTKKIWKQWNCMHLFYDSIAVGHVGKQIDSLPNNNKIWLIPFHHMNKIPAMWYNFVEIHHNASLVKNLEYFNLTRDRLTANCTTPWDMKLEKYGNEVVKFTETYYPEDVHLWNQVRDHAVVEASLSDFGLVSSDLHLADR